MTLPLFDPTPTFDRAALSARLRALAEQNIWIGTSSWKYPGWIGQIYSEDRYRTRGRFSQKRFEAECLSEFAETFPIVCGDFSFYQFPSPEYWQRLFSTAPPELQFALKVPEEVTVDVFPRHARYGPRAGTKNESFLNADAFAALFLEPLQPYRDRVSALIFEFGARGASDCVVLDEFHERHLDTDLALALLKRIGKRIVVMSATLDAAPVARFLGDCPVVRSEGRLFPIQIDYTPHSAAPLEEQVREGLERVLTGKTSGDVLVFLPGAAEIRRCARALEPLAVQRNLLVTSLHGDLSPAEQDRAVTPADRRKIILSTNIAESSVTIEGVTAVIDSGLARVPVDSPWTGLPSLHVQRVSQASATQRAGRAGRTAPGHVVRLYTAEDFHRRPAADPPEIARRELSQVVLQLRAMRIEKLEWLDAPPAAAMAAAETLLNRLGATAEMAALPLPPRLARLVLEAASRGAAEKGCAAAAVLSAGERGLADLLALMEREWQPQTRRVYDQLRGLVRARSRAGSGEDAAVLQSVLAAFPDRVARHRRDGELLLSSGGSARLPDCRYDFLVAIDVEDRRDRGLPLVRLAAPIEPEWLLDRATERVTLEWNRAADRVDEVTALVYDQLVIEETRRPAPASDDASRMLAEKAREAGVDKFADREALEQLGARAAFAGSTIDPETALESLCRGRTSFSELATAGLLSALRPPKLDQLAPENLRLPGGRQVKVHYALGKPPWIESRLQDFFGVRETPRVNGTPVVVHLLAPNRRPVQVTSDLAGFWERLYPQVRRELSRRYPKHKWPEKP